MKDDDEKLIITVGELRNLMRDREKIVPFALTPHFNPENIVEIAKSQFPRLEAKVAIQKGLETTKRLLIIVSGICLIAGGALVVFAPENKEGVSYVIAAILAVLPLGAIGVQEFRIRTFGLNIEGGERAVENAVPSDDPGSKTRP